MARSKTSIARHRDGAQQQSGSPGGVRIQCISLERSFPPSYKRRSITGGEFGERSESFGARRRVAPGPEAGAARGGGRTETVAVVASDEKVGGARRSGQYFTIQRRQAPLAPPRRHYPALLSRGRRGTGERGEQRREIGREARKKPRKLEGDTNAAGRTGGRGLSSATVDENAPRRPVGSLREDSGGGGRVVLRISVVRELFAVTTFSGRRG